MKNLLTTPPIRHRDLFVGGIGNRKPKETYTVLDIWNYCNLVFVGSKESVPASSNKEQRLARKAQILADVPPMPSSYEPLFEAYVSKYGLEVVLMACEEYYAQTSEIFPNPEGMAYSLKDAAALFNRQTHMSRVQS